MRDSEQAEPFNDPEVKSKHGSCTGKASCHKPSSDAGPTCPVSYEGEVKGNL